MAKETCFLLLSQRELEAVMQGICEAYGTPYEPGGNTFRAHNGAMEINLIVFTRNMEGEAAEFMQNQINGIWGHFRQVETADTGLKTNLLHQIRLTGCLCIANCGWSDTGGEQEARQVREGVASVLDQLDGLLLADQGTRLLDGDLRLLLDDTGNSEADGFYPMDAAHPGQGAEKNREQLDRRVRSMEYLRARNIYCPAWLPLLPAEAEAPFRSAAETGARAACLLAVSLHAECLCTDLSLEEARGYSDRVLERFGCREALSPKERAFLEEESPEKKEAVNFSWQYENLAVMLWALGLWELPFPDSICDVHGLARFMREQEDMEALLAAAKPRSHQELLDAADLIYRLDWACVDARVNGLPAPGGMDGGVVVERHKSLNWLIGDGDGQADPWDEVDVST